jgi:hypothetical protein
MDKDKPGQVGDIINRLKRRIVQRFIDPEKGITVDEDGRVMIHYITGETLETSANSKVSNNSYRLKKHIRLCSQNPPEAGKGSPC